MTLSTFNALRGYGAAAARPANAQEQATGQMAEKGGAGDQFSAAHALVSTLGGAEKQAQSLIAGAADPHSVIQALAQAELAVETAAVIRDKVVEAYQEILRMPV